MKYLKKNREGEFKGLAFLTNQKTVSLKNVSKNAGKYLCSMHIKKQSNFNVINSVIN
jgi:hypothetical protein